MGKSDDEHELREFDRFLADISRRDLLTRGGKTAAFAAFALALGACTPAPGASQTPQGSNAASPTVAKVKGGHIVEGNPTDMQGLNPLKVSNASSQIVNFALFDSLLTTDAKSELIPVLADGLPTVSSDGLTYTFKIKRNVTWSDGRPLTADDVVFTYRLLFDPAYREFTATNKAQAEETIASVIATDPNTVVIKTKTVSAPFLVTQGQVCIVPKHILGTMTARELNSADFNTAPSVTSGPFKFVRWDKGSQIVMARNETYHLGAPLIDQYIFKIVPDLAAVSNQLKTGEVDIGRVQPADLAAMANEPNVDLVRYLQTVVYFFGYQLDPAKPGSRFFGDKTVRQALRYAVDTEAMGKVAFFDAGQTVTSITPPWSWAVNPETKPRYTYDRAKAEAMLDAAGWKRGAGGIREKDGVPFRFDLLTASGTGPLTSMVEFLQAQWKPIGIDAVPRLQAGAQMTADLAQKKQFDMFVLNYGNAIDPDLSNVIHSRNAGPGGANYWGYKSAEADKLLDDAVATVDRTKRKELYFRLQNLLAEDLPFAPTTLLRSGYGFSKRVRGADWGPFSELGRRPWMKDLWVADGK